MFGLLTGILSKAVGFCTEGIVSAATTVANTASGLFSKEARYARKERKEIRAEAKRLKKERQEKLSPTAAAAAERFKNGGKSGKASPVVFEKSNNFQD